MITKEEIYRKINFKLKVIVIALLFFLTSQYSISILSTGENADEPI